MPPIQLRNESKEKARSDVDAPPIACNIYHWWYCTCSSGSVSTNSGKGENENGVRNTVVADSMFQAKQERGCQYVEVPTNVASGCGNACTVQ